MVLRQDWEGTQIKPINLNAKCGGRWQIVTDRRIGDGPNDPWSQVVVCQHGLLYPAGMGLIGAVTKRPGEIVDRLRGLAGVGLVSEDEHGAAVVFPEAQLTAVAKLLQPKAARPRRFPSRPGVVVRGTCRLEA